MRAGLFLVLAWIGSGATAKVDTAPPSISLQLDESIRATIKCSLASVRDDPVDCGDKLTAIVCEAGERQLAISLSFHDYDSLPMLDPNQVLTRPGPARFRRPSATTTMTE